jgi:hypothetical protein
MMLRASSSNSTDPDRGFTFYYNNNTMQGLFKPPPPGAGGNSESGIGESGGRGDLSCSFFKKRSLRFILYRRIV